MTFTFCQLFQHHDDGMAQLQIGLQRAARVPAAGIAS